MDNARIFSPTLVNEFRFGFNHFYNDIGGPLANVTGSFGTITSTRAGIDMREWQFSLKLIF